MEEKLIIHNKNWYDQKKISVSLNQSAKVIDIKNKKIIFQNNGECEFDKLILAAGALPFVPPIEGVRQKGVFTLRTIDDAKAIKHYCRGKKTALVLGAGLLGIEAANSLKESGLSVTVIEVYHWLLPRQLDKEGSLVMQSMLEARGLSFLIGRQISTITRTLRGLVVEFSDYSMAEADMVLITAGIKPDLDMLNGTDIETGRGVKVDSTLSTNIEDIYACGDMAEYDDKVYGTWQAGKEQGHYAGLNAIGLRTEYRGTVAPMKLKVMGIDFVSLGEIETGEKTETVVKKDRDVYKKIYITDNKIRGAILLGNTKETRKLQEMIKHQQDVRLVKEQLV
jgi:nitrite reductase (NADH) large subunit